MRFKNRQQGGQILAEALADYKDRPDTLVLALPRGGVPVALEVAKAIHAPMDVFLVRKLGAPGQEELAMGAVASGGVRVLNWSVVQNLRVSEAEIDAVTAEEQKELERREAAYRGDRPLPQISGKTVILVDDGIATGATMRAAVQAVRAQHPARVIVAVPTAAEHTCDQLRSEVDEIVCATMPYPFEAIGLWYEDFPQLSDDDVRRLLEAYAYNTSSASAKTTGRS